MTTVLLKPADGGRPIVLDKPILLIGRHPDCDVILKRSVKISRKHCCIALVDNRFVVRDLDSMNGVWLNGDRVEHSATLSFGDELMIGDLAFEVARNGSAAPDAASEETPQRARQRQPDPDEETARADQSPPAATQAASQNSADPVVRRAALRPGSQESFDLALENGAERDVVEYSSAFAIPIDEDEENSGDDFVIPLAEFDD